MQRVHAEPRLESASERTELQGRVHACGLVLLCLLAVIGVFHQTFVEMVRVWGQSQTYSHGYLVLPIFAFLVWQRSEELAATPVRPFGPAVLLALGAGFVWLLGEVASALALSFFAMIALVPLTVATVLGIQWARILVFPFAMLFFAVPFGEALIPPMMQWTADITVAALKASGVPLYREGQHFVIPSGSWSVVEACSGVRYLIASIFAGALYAWQMYRTPRRRIAFLLAAAVVPIVANWMRAYLIVMLGHLSDNRVAAGVDHLIYGWIFFGVVILILFAIGAIWREDIGPGEPRLDARSGGPAARPLVNGQTMRWAALMLAALLVAPTAAAVLMRPLPERALPAAVIDPVMGWKQLEAPITDWRPHLQQPAREQSFAFEKGRARVGVFLGFFRDQRQGAELISSVNQLADRDKGWQRHASETRQAEVNGGPLTVESETLRGGSGTILAWRWYCLDGLCTASDARAKLHLAFDRLLRRDDTSAWIAVYVVNPESAAAGHEVLGEFVKEMGGPLARSIQQVTGR